MTWFRFVTAVKPPLCVLSKWRWWMYHHVRSSPSPRHWFRFWSTMTPTALWWVQTCSVRRYRPCVPISRWWVPAWSALLPVTPASVRWPIAAAWLIPWMRVVSLYGWMKMRSSAVKPVWISTTWPSTPARTRTPVWTSAPSCGLATA